MIKSAPAPPQKCPGLDSKSYMRLTQITCLLPLLCRCSPGGQGCGANLYNSRPTPSLTICVSVHDSTVIAFCTCGFLFSFETWQFLSQIKCGLLFNLHCNNCSQYNNFIYVITLLGVYLIATYKLTFLKVALKCSFLILTGGFICWFFFKERREREIDHLPPTYALTWDWTGNFLVYGMMLQPTDPPGQGYNVFLK